MDARPAKPERLLAAILVSDTLQLLRLTIKHLAAVAVLPDELPRLLRCYPVLAREILHLVGFASGNSITVCDRPRVVFSSAIVILPFDLARLNHAEGESVPFQRFRGQP